MNNQELLQWVDNRLNELKSNKQAEFSSSLTPGSKPMLGVKIPELRKIAKQLAREDYNFFLKNAPEEYWEYQQLKAFTIGYIKTEVFEVTALADEFIPRLQDWSVNDSLCQNFTIAKKSREQVWNWLMCYVDKDDEYSQRVVAVMMLSHFLVEEYIDRVLAVCDRLQNEGYYAKMAVAWCVATAYAKFPKQTHEYMLNNKLCDWTYNKAIQKMIESYRVCDGDKVVLRTMKRT